MNTAIKKNLVVSILASAALFATACGNDDGGEIMSVEQQTTTEFRQALVNEDDIVLEFDANDGTRSQALAGDVTQVGALTADAVINTNIFIYQHIATMRLVTSMPPTYVGQNSAIWEGSDDGIFYRVKVEKSQTPRGVRYDYSVLGGKAEDGGLQVLPLLDGHVTRIDTRPAELGKQGFGVVRFHFSNINTLNPEEEISGIARIAFRRVAKVRQVHVRMLGVTSAEDPDFPVAAEYKYTQLPQGGGAMAWFSVNDMLKDGLPLEKIAVHSVWRADHSGIGSATAFGGSLDVDYWHMGECWDKTGIKGYEKLATPGMTHETGDVLSCFNLPEELEVPDYQEDLPDEDPAIPAPHAAEGN